MIFENTKGNKSLFFLDKFNGNPVRLIALSFIGVILVGTLLLMLPASAKSGEFTPFTDALFTATSATCVTGLVVYDTYTHWTFLGQLVILVLIQIGGLGLVTLTSFFSVMVGRKLGFRGMELAKESVNTESFADVKKMLHAVISFTFAIEAVGAILLGAAFVPKYGTEGIWLSIFLSISAFCNAGFDLLGRESEFISLMNYSSEPYVYMVISMLIIFGGLGFIVWREVVLYPKTHNLSLHTRVVLWMTGVLLVLGFVVFTVLEWNNPNTMGGMSVFDKIGAGFFQSVTTRTAGFNTIDQAGMTDLSKMVTITFMFIGASPASTGGGIKTTTIAVIFMTIICAYRGREDTVILRRVVDKKAVYRAFALFFSAITIAITASLVLGWQLSGVIDNPIDIVYEVVSAIGTVGLSVGVTAEFNEFTKLLISICMYIGRVGPLTMIVSFMFRSTRNKEILPQGRIIIG